MRSVGIFIAGVATGWVLRSSFDSFRDLAVNGLTAWYDMGERAKRFVAVEREYFEDLFAEARSKFDSKRVRRAVKRAVKTERQAHKSSTTAQA